MVGQGESSRKGGPRGVSWTGRGGSGLAWWGWKEEEEVRVTDSWGRGETAAAPFCRKGRSA